MANADTWTPCGGKEDKLWSWAWAGVGGENVTVESEGKGDRIVFLADLSGNGHHYRAEYSTGAASGWPFYEPGLSLRQSWGSYELSLAPLLRDELNDGTEVYGQWMDQDGSLDAEGAFYLAAVITNTRSGGTRELWGRDADNNVALRQGDDQVRVVIAGDSVNVTDRNAVPRGPLLLEIWRDATDTIHVWANGRDIGSGATAGGRFAMSGVGYKGDGTSGWDDYAFEFIVCDGLPSSDQRGEVWDQMKQRWNLDGLSEPMSAPKPPESLVAD